MTRLVPMPTLRGRISVAGLLDCGHFLWIRHPAERHLAYQIREPYCSICERLRGAIHWWSVEGQDDPSTGPSIRPSGKST
jgi:hypothetical protein